MEIAYLKKTKDVLKKREKLERELGVKIVVAGKKIIISGNPLDEYLARRIFDAIRFGFSVEKSLELKDEEAIFCVIHIKDHTKRNLRDVKSRLIGKNGKTKKVIAQLSDSSIVITDGDVGFICDAETAREIETAIINLIKGSKQSNVYKYLERMNAAKKSIKY